MGQYPIAKFISRPMSLLAEVESLPKFDKTAHSSFPAMSSLRVWRSDLDSEFWNVLVLKLCYTEDTLRSAVLALGSFYIAFLQRQGQLANDENTYVCALRQYTKATATNRFHIEATPTADLMFASLVALVFYV